MIPRELEAEILRLYHAEHWRIVTLATQLQVHHSTVRRVLAQAGIPAAQQSVRRSIVDPFIPFIVETLEKYPRLTASRLYEMVRARGYPGAPDHFRSIVARLRPKPPAQAYLRLRTLPGEQAQVDWAHFGKLQIGRASRPLMGFVMVLSFSRHLFLRFYLNAQMNNYLRDHVDAIDRLHHAAPSVKELFLLSGQRAHHLGVLTRGLLQLLDSHGPVALDEAIRDTLEQDAPHLGAVRQLIDRRRHARGLPPPLPVHLPDDPRVRDLHVQPHSLTDYEALQHDHFHDCDDKS